MFTLRELKVINYPDSLVLIGTDLLGQNPGDGYTFAYLGINPLSRVGEVVFATQNGEVFEACELTQWPHAGCVLRASSPPLGPFSSPISPHAPDSSTTSEDPARTTPGAEDSRRFLALVRS